VTVLDECAESLGYGLPVMSALDKTGHVQVQKWFLLGYQGAADDTNAFERESESDRRWRWMPL
jgi:hypothetical protein